MKTPTVLVIEDSPEAARLMRDMLVVGGKAAFKVECAERLTTGLQRLEEGGIDAVVLDLGLPDSSGINTLLRVAAQARNVPVVVVTGSDDESWVLESARCGAEDYLVKGWLNTRILTHSICYAIERHRLRSELRQKADHLQLSEARFRTMIEANGDGILIVSHDGNLLYMNPAASTMLGQTQEGLVGQRFGFPVLAGDKADLDLVRPDGRQAAAEMRVVETMWEGQPVYLTSLRDVTYRRRAENELREANDQLTCRNELIGSFHQCLSHEINTPLASIREFLALVLDGIAGPISDDQRRYLQFSRESCDQMALIINDLVDVARLETGKLEVDQNPTSIGDVVERVVDTMSSAAQSRGINLGHAMGRDLPPVLIDEKRITQVLTNLLSNALKFTPPGGRVAVAAENWHRDPRFVVVSVSDTGRGIPQEHLARIFDKFYQAERNHCEGNSCTAGLGLGLSICQDIVRLHEGEIWAVSEIGKGSAFSFTLPNHRARQAEPA